jgi:hypothetical protein
MRAKAADFLSDIFNLAFIAGIELCTIWESSDGRRVGGQYCETSWTAIWIWKDGVMGW